MNYILSEKERDVLASLYKLGEVSVCELAKENMINRTTVYPVLERLLEKGLVSKISVGNKDVFKAISEKDLETWIAKRNDYFKLENQKLIRSAKNQNQNKSLLSKVSYFEGMEGVKNLYADTWRENTNKMIYAITDFKSAQNDMEDFFLNDYLPKRVAHGVRVKNLIPESIEGRKHLKNAKEMLREMKFIKLFQDLEIEINVYDDKLAVVAFDKKNPSGVIIKNQKIAEAMKNIFEYLWKTSK
ncbi:MAG: helix-turn-helix domain-containing protein [bacterium]|nr:helix-turn-helix domain-containing protein [bacterium]